MQGGMMQSVYDDTRFWIYFLAAALLQIIVLKLWSNQRRRQSGIGEFPGPKGVPIFGNEAEIPDDKQWIKFHEWSQKYGDVFKINARGQPILVLSSPQAAFELLEGRGTIYSDRPPAVMAGELVGWNRGLGYSPYGERFKEFRKMFHQTMGPRQTLELMPLQKWGAAKFMLRLLEYPEGFIEHARQSTGAVILLISYGYTIIPSDDPFVKIAEDAMRGFSKASEPGAYMVDQYPILKHIPAWFPGGGFQNEAKVMREELDRLYDVPYEFVKKEMSKGTATPSFTSKYLLEKQDEKQQLSQYDIDFVKAAAGSLYSGGADTTPSSITSFILAMVLHPEVQIKAQAEIDAILCSPLPGTDTVEARTQTRMPDFSDRERLPYVNAMVKEVLRWNPAVPLGLPHQILQEDVYRGCRVPSGSIVYANIWSIFHNEEYFDQPFSFMPERFLDQNQKENDRMADLSPLAFGLGRRVCPGMHFADNSLFITVTTMLAVFDIRKARDENGREITPEVDYRGFISHPVPFQCDIRPRSEATARLIRRAAED